MILNKWRALLAAAALLLGAPLAAQSAPQGEVVATASGQVEGFIRGGALEFRGIPYPAFFAAPQAKDPQ